MKAVGHGNGKGIHRQPDAEQDTVQAKQQLLFHFLSFLPGTHCLQPYHAADRLSREISRFTGVFPKQMHKQQTDAETVEFGHHICYNNLFIITKDIGNV
jgi:hypothetical protein